jgi:hypothetical protein
MKIKIRKENIKHLLSFINFSIPISSKNIREKVKIYGILNINPTTNFKKQKRFKF